MTRTVSPMLWKCSLFKVFNSLQIGILQALMNKTHLLNVILLNQIPLICLYIQMSSISSFRWCIYSLLQQHYSVFFYKIVSAEQIDVHMLLWAKMVTCSRLDVSADVVGSNLCRSFQMTWPILKCSDMWHGSSVL